MIPAVEVKDIPQLPVETDVVTICMCCETNPATQNDHLCYNCSRWHGGLSKTMKPRSVSRFTLPKDYVKPKVIK